MSPGGRGLPMAMARYRSIKAITLCRVIREQGALCTVITVFLEYMLSLLNSCCSLCCPCRNIATRHLIAEMGNVNVPNIYAMTWFCGKSCRCESIDVAISQQKEVWE